MRRKHTVLGAGLLAFGLVFGMAVLGTAAPASAQEDQRGVITLAEVTITGRIQKPIAAVDVNRIQPKLTLAELRQPFLDRIEQALYADPF
jgi:hypothetical protein